MTIFDQLHAGVMTASAAETQALATALAVVLPPDTTLALHGNLGVGKTTFVQGLARGFGITTPVTSPTFNIYTVHHGNGGGPRRSPGAARRTLVHLDAYRLDHPQQVEDLLIEDFLVSPWCLAVEWPEKIGAWLPAGALHLDLGVAPDERHTLKLRNGG